MNHSLLGKIALVGGSTDGIGKAIALSLAEAGATVWLLARNEEKLKTVCALLATTQSQKHQYFVADFSDNEAVKKVAERIKNSKETVHILVNNTGGPAPIAAIDADVLAYQQAFNMHLVNNQLLTQAVVEGMKNSNYGRIINIVSVSVREPIVGLSVSNTTRWAVAAWAKTLSKELGAFQITVNNVLPGYIATQRLESLLQQRANTQNKNIADIKSELIKDIPANRIGKPEEIAAAVTFLASPAAAYINGVNLPIDGGRLHSM